MADWIFNRKKLSKFRIDMCKFIKIYRFMNKIFSFFSQISVRFWKIKRQITRHIINTYLHTKATQTDKFLQIYWYSIHVYWCALEFFFLAAVHKWRHKIFPTFWPLHFFKRDGGGTCSCFLTSLLPGHLSLHFLKIILPFVFFHVCYHLWSILMLY